MTTYLSPKQRFHILQRDNFTCVYCGRKPPEITLHVEHRKAKVNGGSNEEENLVAACASCNHGKYAKDYKEKYGESDLIKRTYRITEKHDQKIKRLSKKSSESQIVRDAIDLLPESNAKSAQPTK